MSAAPIYLYTALIDVLAYRGHLEEDRKTGTLAFQEKLTKALAVFDTVNESVFRVQAISDTIILTCSTHADFPEFLKLLKTVFLAFLRQGLFIRGGVAYSRHFQSKHLTYSHAVARAYELESKISVYPRIVIDDNIINMYDVGNALPPLRDCGLLCRHNGVYFLDILDSTNWAEVHGLAKSLYNASEDSLIGNETALIKHILFERYLMDSKHATSGAVAYIQSIEEA